MKTFALSLALLLTLAACAKPVTRAPGISADAVRMEEGVQRDIIKQGNTIRRTPVTPEEMEAIKPRLAAHAGRVREAGKALCRNMGRDPERCVYGFALRPEENLNAYADGEKIYITAQMMRFAHDDDTLGMVLSHEYAHNIMNHVASKQKNMAAGLLLGTVVDVLASSQGYQTGGEFSKIGASGGARVYSPQFENEADYVGLYVMALGGYDIARASDLWRRMSVADPDGAFMGGTHPVNPERYVRIERAKEEIIEKARNNTLLVPNIRPEE
jgi:predicted Zn-dependent protease